MELSERIIQTLEKEGFSSVYEVSDAANLVHPERNTAAAVAIVVTDGSIMYSINGNSKTLGLGDRLDISRQTTYSATVGLAGCNYVVGENS